MKNLTSQERKVLDILENGKKSQKLLLEGFDKPIWLKHKNNGYFRPLQIGESIKLIDREKLKEEKEKLTKEILSMDVIPTTIENLSVVLEHLNSQNWGSWSLPKMSIGYKAAQYNCEGRLITTITLNNSIEFCGKMETKFKSGRDTRFLTKYNCI